MVDNVVNGVKDYINNMNIFLWVRREEGEGGVFLSGWGDVVQNFYKYDGKERYVFLYDDNNRAETLRTLGRYAKNDELSFTWYDAAILSQKIRQGVQKLAPEARFDISLLSDLEDSLD